MKAFRGGHTDLGSAMGVQHTVRLASEGVLPTTLTIDTTRAPFSSLRAVRPGYPPSRPDEIVTNKSFFSIIGSRVLNPDLDADLTGVRTISSSRYFPTRPACQLVPQATIQIRPTSKLLLGVNPRPEDPPHRCHTSSGRIVSRMVCGCSWISST
ncbi:MAG: hypothetical protein U0361_21590 [Nitrospiraceae bacterium]